jgi:hypothetical protein
MLPANSHEENVRRHCKLPFVLHGEDLLSEEVSEEAGLLTLQRSHLLPIEDSSRESRCVCACR